MSDPEIEELQAKVSLNEHLLEELNQTVYRQQQQIDQLRRELMHFKEQMEGEMQAGGASPSADAREDIPPHY